MKIQYLTEKSNFLKEGPGMLTEDFNYVLKDEWQFVTRGVQHYCIILNRQNVNKNSSLPNISSTHIKYVIVITLFISLI